MKNLLCIYHGQCKDGFGAAWVVYHYWSRLTDTPVEFHAGLYGAPPPDVTGRDVVIVDFSYKRPVLLEMGEKARSVLILDHHKSAMEDLIGLEGAPPDWDYWQKVAGAYHPHIAARFDMSFSGAGLTWDYFFPTEPRPRLINHIEDRDLGGGIAFPSKLPGTREIDAALSSYPFDFQVWGDLMVDFNRDEMISDGIAIDRKWRKDIADFVETMAHRAHIGGYVVPACNLPKQMASDAGHMMAQGEAFAACYFCTQDGMWEVSLRSSESGIDVSEVARQYGGGGHKHAAGFRVKTLFPAALGEPA